MAPCSGLVFAAAPELTLLNLANREGLVGSLCKKARCHPLSGLQPLVGGRFRSFSPPCSGCFFFTFPPRYLFAIGLQGVFSPPMVLADSYRIPVFRTLGYSPCWTREPSYAAHALRRAFPPLPHSCPRLWLFRYPARAWTPRFGLCPVLPPPPGVSLLFSLPAGTGMFRFPAFAPGQAGGRYHCWWVAPFDTADQRLLAPPAAFRRLLRPSSPPGGLGIHRRPYTFFSFLRQGFIFTLWRSYIKEL